ncbi:AraC family transcriptional regulator [Agaribacter flavus]|uniref:Helix-turn-helix domain-containing protein n=1 Tax=Agaribacter flavus TaxID=1902781 RepID=A0ABV7FN67_9ALTE
MFDLLPGVFFWIKDHQGCFMHVNQALIAHTGGKNKSAFLGKQDKAFFPPHLAKQYMNDDKRVMSGEHISNRLELNMLKNGDMAWFSTSKRPLFNKDEKIIGTYGYTFPLEQSHILSHADLLKQPISFIKENFQREFTIEELAQKCFLSVSALERRFKKHLSKTPKQFINEYRLEKARRLLIESSLPIAEVAEDCGFHDHSYFSKQFAKMFGMLPSACRQMHYDDPDKQ